MELIKKRTPWWKGKKLSEEHKRKIGESQKGRVVSEETKNKLRNCKRSDESKKRYSLSKMGSKNPAFGKPKSPLNLKMLRKANLGNKYCLGVYPSEETRRKLSASRKGEKNWNWQGGISASNQTGRHSIEYVLCREKAFERDNYTCVQCKVRGGYLEPHHVKAWAYYPELRFDVNNIQTLCVPCHEKTEGYRRNKKKIV